MGGVVAANVAHGRNVGVDQGVLSRARTTKSRGRGIICCPTCELMSLDTRKGTSDSQGMEAQHWHILVWTDGSREYDVSSWLKVHSVHSLLGSAKSVF